MSSLTVAQRAVGAIVGNIISDAAGYYYNINYEIRLSLTLCDPNLNKNEEKSTAAVLATGTGTR